MILSPKTQVLTFMACLFASVAFGQTRYTQCTDPNTILPVTGVSCNSSAGVADNQWWRVYNLATLQPGTAYRVEAFRVGIEETSTAPNTFELRVYVQTGAAFPGGTRTLQGTTQTIVEPAAGAYNNTVQVFALNTPLTIPANSTIVIEFAVLNNQTLGGTFFPGVNNSGESSPLYISSTACGLATPTTLTSLGFNDQHMILDVIGNGPEMDVQRPASTSIADGGTDNLGTVSTSGQAFTYTIQNTGFANLQLPGTPVTVTAGTGSPTVSVTTQPAASVPFSGGNTTTFVVQVTPATGAFAFTVSIASGTTPILGLDFNENPYNFTVNGTGSGASAPEMDVTRSAAAIADNGTDTVSGATAGVASSLTYTFTNSGTANLTLTNPATVAPVSNCTISITTPPTTPVAASGNTTTTVSVTPSAAGAFSATYSIANNDSNENPYNWTISGTASATPSSEMDVTRGASPITDGGTDTVTGATAGTASNLTYTFTNNGTANLTLTNPATVTPVSNCTISITSAPTTPVAASGNTTTTVTVTPSAAGAFSATYSIANNDANENPYNWTISGTASATASPEMDVTNGATAVVDGTTDALGTVSTGANTVTYTITNSGTAGLNLTGAPSLVTVTAGTNVSAATLTTPPAASVAAAGNTTFTVSYTVTAAGVFNFTLSIPNNDANENPYDWTASGTGASAPEMGVNRGATAITDGGSDNLGNVNTGAASNFTYTIANTGSAALTITLPVSITGQSNCTATVSTSPAASVAAAGNTTMVISVTPTAAGAFSFNVSITNDDANENPYNWTVSGTGTAPGTGGGVGGGGGGGGCSTEEGGLLSLLMTGLVAAAVFMRRRKLAA